MSFAVGESVRVSARGHEGHHRTPTYVKGRRGVVVRTHSDFRNPEARAYGGDGLPERRLYLVEFAQSELWSNYRGHADDRALVDLFEHWLERDA